MKSWIVLEGPDGGGKSTLAASLARHISYEHGATVLQSLRQHSAESEYIQQPLRFNLAGLHVVQDRSLLSRIAYQPVALVPGAEAHDLDEAREAFASVAHKVAVLHLTADEDVLAERISDDPYFHPDMLGPLLKSYWKTMAWWESVGGWVHTIDTSDWFPGVDHALLALSSSGRVRLGETRSSLIQ